MARIEPQPSQNAARTSVEKVERPGLSPNAAFQDSLSDATRAQAMEAVRGISLSSISRGMDTQGPQTSVINNQGGYQVEVADTAPGRGNTAAQFQYAQDGLTRSGVTMEASQNTLTPQQSANFQAMLDNSPPNNSALDKMDNSALAKSPETSHNIETQNVENLNMPSGSSPLEAARQQAITAPAQEPERSRGK